MAEIDLDGVRLFYEEWGAGASTVVFSHSYLADHSHFENQIRDLAADFRVIAWDHRDHGGSERLSKPYGMEEIYRDGEKFLERVVGDRCHFVGLSTGGFVGLRLAIRRPDLLRSATIMSAAADREPRAKRLEYELLFLVLRIAGAKPLGGRIMRAMFGEEFLRALEREEERRHWRGKLTSIGRSETIRFGRAIFGRESVEGELSRITVPTLVVAGEQDRAVSPARSQKTAAAIPGCRYEVLRGAGHLSTIEVPDAVNRALRFFFRSAA